VSPERPSAEAAFAENLKALRSSASMTQAQLSEQMSIRGFKWHPATVYKVENGERQIQLAEAVEIARIFDTSVEDMTLHGLADLAAVRGLHNLLRRTREDLLMNIGLYESQRSYLAVALADDNARKALPAHELEQMLTDADPDSGLMRVLKQAFTFITGQEWDAKTQP
jgi:transcriptional regulator with XRE-family HTH domain